MDLSKNNHWSNFSDKVLLGFTYLNSFWFLSCFVSCLFYWGFFFIISIIIILIIIIIIIKTISFFIAFWGIAIYIIIKITLIIIVIISFIDFCRFFFFSLVFRFGTATALTICNLFFIVPFFFSSFKKFLLFSVVIY